jgi:hypothetical protein
MRRELSTGEDVVDLLRRAYLDYGTRFIGAYRSLFDLLLEPDRHALLFHCSAGKDRTGLAAALILTALGASRETVMEDYRATDRIWRRDLALPPGTPKPLADALTPPIPSCWKPRSTPPSRPMAAPCRCCSSAGSASPPRASPGSATCFWNDQGI